MFHENQQIGNYTLIKKLGRGGFGEVWLAENNDEYFAVKLPHKDQVDWKAITQEIGLWTLCGTHPNLMPLVGARNFNGQIAIISEYAPDGSLEDLLKEKGKLSEIEAVEMTIGILEGLQHLHESGIIHRDLKPANILLNGKTPRLTDFGISRIITADSLSETISGTWAYMAPECFDGKRNIQTDVWSVGVILYKMLTGNLPFPQKEQTSLVGAIIMREPELSCVEISPFLRKQVLPKILSKISTDRFDSKYFLLDLKGYISYTKKKAIRLKKQQSLLEENLIPYRKGNKWGFCDANKNVLIIPKYDEVYPFSEGMSVVKLYDKYGFINKNGEEIIKIKYDDANSFSENLALVYLDKNYGYIDKNGKAVIDFIYDNAGDFCEGLAYVEINYPDDTFYSSFIDKTGKDSFETDYFIHSGFDKGLCCLMDENGSFGFADKNGKVVIPLIYDDVSMFSEELSIVRIGRKLGFINKANEVIHEIKYSRATDFIGGMALVEYNQRKFFINKLGQELFMPSRVTEKYNDMDLFDEELIQVKISNGNHLKGKFGFIDKSGNETIPIKYDWTACRFESNLIKVKLDDKYFYIGKDGTEYFED